MKDNYWIITVTDDGKGFDPNSIEEVSTGNGLANMKQRVAEANYKLKVQSSKDKGTSMMLSIPVNTTSNLKS